MNNIIYIFFNGVNFKSFDLKYKYYTYFKRFKFDQNTYNSNLLILKIKNKKKYKFNITKSKQINFHSVFIRSPSHGQLRMDARLVVIIQSYRFYGYYCNSVVIQ